MPKIPEFQQQSGTLPENPVGVDINPNAFGNTDEVLSKIGATTSELGLELLKKQKNAEDIDFAYNTKAQRQIEISKYSTDLAVQMNGDFKGYTQGMADYINNINKEDQQNAPSESARQKYLELTNTSYTNEISQAYAKEHQQRAANAQFNYLDGARKTADMLVTNPNPDAAEQFLLDTTDQANEYRQKGIWAADTHAINSQDARNTIQKGFFEGLLRSGFDKKEYLQMGLDYLYGKTTASDQSSQQTQSTRSISLDEAVASKVISAENAKQLKDKGQSSVEIADKQGLTFSGATISRGYLVDALKPNEKQELIHQFQTALKSKESIDLSEYHHKVADGIDSLQRGEGDINPSLIIQMKSLEKDGYITNDERVRTQDTLYAARAAGKAVQQMQMSPANQFSNIWQNQTGLSDQILKKEILTDPSLQSANDPNFNSVARSRMFDYVQGVSQQILKDRQNDPAQQVIAYLPGMKTYADMAKSGKPDALQMYSQKMLAAQTAWGIPRDNQRITTKAEAEQIASPLNSNDANKVASSFTVFEQRYGRYWPEVFDELHNQKLVGDDKWLAYKLKDPYSRENVMGAVVNADAINKGFKDRFPSINDQKDLNDAIEQTSGSYISALSNISDQGGSLEYANGIRRAIDLTAKKLLLTGQADSADSAAKKASQVFQANFGNINAANSNVIYPANERKDLIQSFMESHLNRDAMGEMGVALPGGPETNDVKWNRLEKAAFWQNNANLDGLRLMFRQNDGRPIAAKDANGQDITVRFKDKEKISDQRTLKQAGKGTLEKFFEKLPQIPQPDLGNGIDTPGGG